MRAIQSLSVRVPWLLTFLFVAAIFCPFIKVLPLDTDVQPTALVLGSLICAIRLPAMGFRLPRGLLILSVVPATSLLMLAFSNWEWNSARSVATYFSVFFISVGTYLCARSTIMTSRLLIDVINFTWLAVGLVQSTIKDDFLYIFLSNTRTTADRGVIGLACEPSFYGIMGVVLFLLYYLQGREVSIGAALCIIQILFVAKSPTATMILFAIVGVCLLMQLRVKTILSVCVVAVATYLIVPLIPDISEKRIGFLMEMAVEDPAALLVKDHSASERFYHIAYSLKGAAENWLLPHGYSQWGKYYDIQVSTASNRYLNMYTSTPDRIMSALGTPLFELGLIGMIVPYVVWSGIRRYYGGWNSRSVPFAFGLTLVLLNSLPLAFPPYGFIIGLLYAYRAPGVVVSRKARGARNHLTIPTLHQHAPGIGAARSNA